MKRNSLSAAVLMVVAVAVWAAEANAHKNEEAQKHAPSSASHHETRTRLELGHKKKPLHVIAATKDELKIQEVIDDDAVNHKLHSRKMRSKHDEHGIRHDSASTKKNSGHQQNNNSSTDKRKPPKKVVMNKMKKYKRAKRLQF